MFQRAFRLIARVATFGAIGPSACMGNRSLRFRSLSRLRLFLLAAILASVASPAQATFHEWRITEIYSNASGTIQFVELGLPSSGIDNESFVSGETSAVPLLFSKTVSRRATGGRRTTVIVSHKTSVKTEAVSQPIELQTAYRKVSVPPQKPEAG